MVVRPFLQHGEVFFCIKIKALEQNLTPYEYFFEHEVLSLSTFFVDDPWTVDKLFYIKSNFTTFYKTCEVA